MTELARSALPSVQSTDPAEAKSRPSAPGDFEGSAARAGAGGRSGEPVASGAPAPAPATPTLRREVAIIASESAADPRTMDDVLQSFAEALPAERVAPALLRVHEIRLALQRLESSLELRVADMERATEAPFGVPFAWTDPETGERYLFRAEPRWEIPDVEGFFDELQALGVTLRQVAPAIARDGFRFSVLREKWRDLTREYRGRRYGRKHLVPVEEEDET